MSAKIAIYPGTFDPVTNGHLDIVERASKIFDEVYVTVAINPGKSPMFSLEQRLEFIRLATTSYTNVRVESFNGLIVTRAKEIGATTIIRGIRAVTDFEYEFQMALMNRKLSPDVNTVFLMPHEKYTYLDSTIIRGLAKFDAEISDFVPPFVYEALKKFHSH